MLNKSKHRVHLIQILNFIYKNSKLSSALGFKGGTAAYLFYDLPRFSTDLDFDLLAGKSSVTEIDDLLTSYLSNNYEILDKWDKKNTIFWKLSYEKYMMNIKIEVSKRDSSKFVYSNQTLYGNSVNVITPQHLIVQKFIALRNRAVLAHRDIFDINYFLQSKYATDIDFDLLEELTGQNRVDFLVDLIKYLQKNEPKKILDGLGEVVDEDIKTWIKTEMFAETLNLIRMQVDSV